MLKSNIKTFCGIHEIAFANGRCFDQKVFHEILLQAVSQSIIATDINGLIVYWNKSAERIHGWKQKEVIRKNIMDIAPTNVTEAQNLEIMNTLKEGRTWSGKFWVKRKNGSSFLALINNSPIIDEDGVIIGIVKVSTDLTEQEEKEILLRESERKYTALFNTMAQGVIFQDNNGKITAVNQAAEKILGLTEQQLKKMGSMSSNLNWIREDGSRFNEDEHPAMVSLKSGKRVENVIMGVLTPKGKEHKWIIVSSVPEFKSKDVKPSSVYITFTDITERKEFEQRLNEKTKEAEKLNKFMIDRELVMIKLKKEIEELKGREKEH